MLESSLTSFINALTQRRLVEKARNICARWRAGFIAENDSGEVYIHNGSVEPGVRGWIQSGNPTFKCLHQLVSLKSNDHWHEYFVPVSVLWQPQPGLNAEQNTFLTRLVEKGVIEKAKTFVESWEKDCWIALDHSGSIFLYNCKPHPSYGGVWIRDNVETSEWIKLDEINNHSLDWSKCLVSLSHLEQPLDWASQSTVPPDLDINRMDCWL